MLLLTHGIISHKIYTLLLVVLTLKIRYRESEFPHQVFQNRYKTSNSSIHEHVVLEPVRCCSYFRIGSHSPKTSKKDEPISSPISNSLSPLTLLQQLQRPPHIPNRPPLPLINHSSISNMFPRLLNPQSHNSRLLHNKLHQA
jgi:hypothetical protein